MVGLTGAFIGYYMFNKKVPGLENLEADYSLTANELFDAFDQNEPEALLKYENKILSVTGTVSSVKHGEVSSNIILHADNAMAGGINCSFNDRMNMVEKGQKIIIKGRCQGFLLDVILNNSVINE